MERHIRRRSIKLDILCVSKSGDFSDFRSRLNDIARKQNSKFHKKRLIFENKSRCKFENDAFSVTCIHNCSEHEKNSATLFFLDLSSNQEPFRAKVMKF